MPTKKSKVLVIGSLNVDLVVRADIIPQAGETLKGNSFSRYSGGKGANQAVAAAQLGAQVSMIGRVGTDLFGDEQLRSLTQSGVDVRAVVRDGDSPTGVAVIAVEEQSGQNRIIVIPGANATCSPRDVDEHRALIGAVDVVLAQLEIPMTTVEAAADVALENGVLFILNPAPAHQLPLSLLAKVGVLTPNEHEAESICGISVNDLEGARQAAAFLRDQGVGKVIITLGDRGVYGIDAEGEFHIPAHDVQVVDTVAAGDAFSGALAVALAEGRSLREAAEFANATAAISVTRHGAQASMPDRREVDAFLTQVKRC